LMSASLAPWPVTLLLLFVPSALVALFAFVAPAPLVAFLVSGATLPVALLPVVAFLVSGGTLPVTLPLVKALLVFALSTLFASLAPVALSTLAELFCGAKLLVITPFVALPLVAAVFVTLLLLFVFSLSFELLAPAVMLPFVVFAPAGVALLVAPP